MTARDIMIELAQQGHDVGLHGGYHTALKLENFLHEKHLLEDETGLSITTTRQHWLHWDARITPGFTSRRASQPTPPSAIIATWGSAPALRSRIASSTSVRTACSI